MELEEKDFIHDKDGNRAKNPDGTDMLTKQAKQKIADDKRREMRKNAFDTLRKYAQQALDAGVFLGEDAQAVKQALFDLRPLRSSEPTARVTVQAMLRAFFGDAKVRNGGEAYAAFREGKLTSPDLRKYIALAIKTGKPEDRLWIEYNGKADEYMLVGTGAAAPFGWTGYVPSDAPADTGAVPSA